MFSVFEKAAAEDKLPAFRLNSSSIGSNYSMKGLGGALMEESFSDSEAPSAPAGAARASFARSKESAAGGAGRGEPSVSQAAAPAEEPVRVRSDLSETSSA